MENLTEKNPPRPSNYLALAIISTVMCCVPLGIVAIIQATQVDNLYNAGKYDEALAKSKSAKLWSIIGMVSVGIFIFLYLLFVVIIAAAGQ